MLWGLVSGEGIFGTKSKEADNGEMWEKYFRPGSFFCGPTFKLAQVRSWRFELQT